MLTLDSSSSDSTLFRSSFISLPPSSSIVSNFPLKNSTPFAVSLVVFSTPFKHFSPSSTIFPISSTTTPILSSLPVSFPNSSTNFPSIRPCAAVAKVLE